MANSSSQVGYPPPISKGTHRERLIEVIARGVLCVPVSKEEVRWPNVRLESDEPLPSDFHNNCIIAVVMRDIREQSSCFNQELRQKLVWAGRMSFDNEPPSITVVIEGEIPPIKRNRGIQLVSAKSPLGLALSGAKEPGTIEFHAPRGVVSAEIVEYYD